MEACITAYKQFVDDFKTDEIYQNVKKQPKNISKNIIGLMQKIQQNNVTLQEVMYANAMKEGYVMTNEVGDRIKEGSKIAYEAEEEKEKKELIWTVLDHFRKFKDDPENTVIGNYACDKLVSILKFHTQQIGVKAGIIDVNLKHEQRRNPNHCFKRPLAFEYWKILRIGTIVLYEMESKEYQFARVAKDCRITNEVMDVPLYINADETKMICVEWKKLIIVPSDVVDPATFGGSLHPICKDCADVMMKQIISDMNDFIINKLKDEIGIDISFINRKDSLNRKSVNKIKQIIEQLKTIGELTLNDFFDEVTETLRVKLSSMVDIVRRNVVPTYIIYQNRPKRDIIMGVDYLRWAKNRFEGMIKNIERLVKVLSKEKDSIIEGTLINEMRQWQYQVMYDKCIELLSDNGFDESISLKNTSNIEGVLQNKFIIDEYLLIINNDDIKSNIDKFLEDVLEKLTHYLSKLKATGSSITKINEKGKNNSQFIEALESYVDANSEDPWVPTLQMIIEEMGRVNDLILAENFQSMESEGRRSAFELFVDVLKLIQQEYEECIEQNQEAVNKFNDETSIEKRQTIDGGLSLAPHVQMQRWLSKKQMK